jgi:hypothetical protein
MSKNSQAATAKSFEPHRPEIGCSSSRHSGSVSATSVSTPNVLLIGRNHAWGSTVLKSLAKCGSELSFADPKAVTAGTVAGGTFQLLLLDSTVSPEQRRQLASALRGQATTIFYSFPVENGCWWLPALRHGQDCHGTPAFRRNEFPGELERILQDQA